MTRLPASRTVANASGIRSSSDSPAASRSLYSAVCPWSSASLIATKSSSMALTAREIASSWRRILPSPMRSSLSMMAGTGDSGVLSGSINRSINGRTNAVNSTQRPEPDRFRARASGDQRRQRGSQIAPAFDDHGGEAEPVGEPPQLGGELLRGLVRGTGLGVGALDQQQAGLPVGLEVD